MENRLLETSALTLEILPGRARALLIFNTHSATTDKAAQGSGAHHSHAPIMLISLVMTAFSSLNCSSSAVWVKAQGR